MMEEQGQVTSEAWADWRQHPVTQAFLEVLDKWREGVKEQWAQGSFSDNSFSGNALQTTSALAEAQILERIKSMTVDELNEGLGDNE